MAATSESLLDGRKRCTLDQMDALVTAIELCPSLQPTNNPSADDKLRVQAMWDNLAASLNIIDGPKKDGVSWKNSWLNIKHASKKKYLALLEGNVGIRPKRLSLLEKRILKISGIVEDLSDDFVPELPFVNPLEAASPSLSDFSGENENGSGRTSPALFFKRFRNPSQKMRESLEMWEEEDQASTVSTPPDEKSAAVRKNRCTHAQLDALVWHLERKPGLDRAVRATKLMVWNKIAARLNALDSTKKTGNGWKESLLDYLLMHKIMLTDVKYSELRELCLFFEKRDLQEVSLALSAAKPLSELHYRCWKDMKSRVRKKIRKNTLCNSLSVQPAEDFTDLEKRVVKILKDEENETGPPDWDTAAHETTAPAPAPAAVEPVQIEIDQQSPVSASPAAAEVTTPTHRKLSGRKRCSAYQLEALVSELEQYSRSEINYSWWNQVAQRLNVLTGTTKTARGWKECWKDLKSRARKKLQKNAQSHSIEISPEALTDLEKRVVVLMRRENTYNDSMEPLDPLEMYSPALLVDCITNEPPSPAESDNGTSASGRGAQNPAWAAFRRREISPVSDDSDDDETSSSVAPPAKRIKIEDEEDAASSAPVHDTNNAAILKLGEILEKAIDRAAATIATAVEKGCATIVTAIEAGCATIASAVVHALQPNRNAADGIPETD